ncbi:alpha/beta hydrolase [Pantoea sp. NPDC088449]|uniref:alpha/beta hydrolase n=1 Tax=Pantoea sp. NPDC088449 TaxID=3364392 RepID=UPI00381274D2
MRSDAANALYKDKIGKLLKRTAVGVLVLLIVFLGIRGYQSEQGPPLHRWHTWAAHEMAKDEIDRASFADYLAREDAIFHDMKVNVTDQLSDEDKTPLNRFNQHSSVYPARFDTDWNRSFILEPEGEVKGAVVLLHGLTDSPYSMRYLAQAYQQKGFVAVVPRLPGHGTAPGSLTKVDWQMWMAVTRLAVREATRLAGNNVPLHLVGYSNGGALAVKYSLDSLQNNALRKPQQIVLLSPMIGVTAYARFAGLAGWPAAIPGFAKAAWLSIVPEYNPFKYNSFPVRAARQSWLLTQAMQDQMLHIIRSGTMQAFPPVLTFQSVLDSTVSTRAVVNAFYRYLPDNGSELVMFDINQAANLRALFRPALYSAANSLLPPAPRRYTSTVITNASPNTYDTVARITPAEETQERVRSLHAAWPQDTYSLSHIALPFPLSDSLYGREPSERNRYGISFGTISLRGETASLIVGLDTLMRNTSNPFFDFMMLQIKGRIDCSSQADVQPCLKAL